jgi:poly(glycerol-phosphate) alpha-glucosyltransferase
MKVALLTSWMSRGGGGIFDAVQRMAYLLHAAPDLQVSVLGLADRGGACDAEKWNGIATSALPIFGPSAWGYAPQLASRLLGEGIDLLHVHGLWMYPSAASLNWSRATDHPYMITPHGMLDSWAIRNSRWKKRAALWAYEGRHLKGAACLHALCEAEAESIRAFGLRNPICIVPNSIHQSAAADPSRNRAAGAPSRTLLYIGRLHPKKGLVNLLKAWHGFGGRRSATGGNWQLVIAGWSQGGHDRELAELVAELGIGESVRFPGPSYGAEKDALFRQAAAFILPSVSEGVPMAVLEAWSYGLPVLMTRQCNLPEGFTAGAALPIGADAPGIVEGLKHLASMSEQDRRKMGERGLQLCEERFSPQPTINSMMEVYRWLARLGPRPSCLYTN